MVEIDSTGDLRKRTNKLFVKYGFRPSPVLDQNFLVDFGIIQRMLRYANVNKEDTVLEIGPGLGYVTEELLKNAGKVIAIEKDRKLENILKEELKADNFELIIEDCLNTDFPSFNKIVSHIPFSISAPLTFKFLDYDFELAVVLYQREFGEKMVTEPGDPKYGRLSVMMQYYFDVELKEIVPRNAFYPQPNVDGVVMLLKKKPVERDTKFDVFVREIFRYKNKNVKNAVKLAVGKDIEDNRKIDFLSVPEIIELYNKIKAM